MLKEWPLVAFTILGQMAVGLFSLTGFFLLVIWSTPSAAGRRTLLFDLALVLGLLITAALVSFFHLRHPLRARRVLANLRTSWLSREIFFELGFMGLVAVAGLQTWRGAERSVPFAGVLVAACVAGALFLVSMSKLYMLPALPAWNIAYTPLSFGLTALILGALSLAISLRFGGGSWDTSRLLLRLSSMALVVEIPLAIFIAPRHGICVIRPRPSLRPVDELPRLLHWGRVALLGAGLVFVEVEFFTGIDGMTTRRGPGPALILAFMLILLGEIAGRFHFYGLVARPGR